MNITEGSEGIKRNKKARETNGRDINDRHKTNDIILQYYKLTKPSHSKQRLSVCIKK